VSYQRTLLIYLLFIVLIYMLNLCSLPILM